MNSTKHFYRIREVSELLGVPASTLRYWENEFPMLNPNRVNDRRVYTNDDYNLCVRIKELLYDRGLKIEAAREHLLATYRKNAPRKPYVCNTRSDALNLLCEVTKMVDGDPHATERIKAVIQWLEAGNNDLPIIHKNIRGAEYFKK